MSEYLGKAKTTFELEVNNTIWPIGTTIQNLYYDDRKRYCGTFPDGFETCYINPDYFQVIEKSEPQTIDLPYGITLKIKDKGVSIEYDISSRLFRGPACENNSDTWEWWIMMDGWTSLLIALAANGVDMTSEAVRQAVIDSMDACAEKIQ